MKINKHNIKPHCKMPRKMKKFYRAKFVDMIEELNSNGILYKFDIIKQIGYYYKSQ